MLKRSTTGAVEFSVKRKERNPVVYRGVTKK